MNNQTFSTKEAADRLQVSERTIRNMIKRRSIRAYKIDPTSKSVLRIPRSEIDRILQERKESMEKSR
jgi:excisionase family DNA binding protein